MEKNSIEKYGTQSFFAILAILTGFITIQIDSKVKENTKTTKQLVLVSSQISKDLEAVDDKIDNLSEVLKNKH